MDVKAPLWVEELVNEKRPDKHCVWVPVELDMSVEQTLRHEFSTRTDVPVRAGDTPEDVYRNFRAMVLGKFVRDVLLCNDSETTVVETVIKNSEMKGTND